MPSSSNKKNTPQDAADASHSETPAPNKKAVLDSSGDGGPFIPGYTGGWGVAAGLGNAGGAPSSDSDLVVEIELVAGAAALGAALTTNMAGFMAGSESAAPPTDTGLRSILNQYGLKEAQAVFSAEQIKADEERKSSLRQAAALGAASPEQVSALERLPALDSFIRLRFPANTSPAEITAALKRFPEIARAVVAPRAAPPMVMPGTPAPSDPLIGKSGILINDQATDFDSQWYLHRNLIPQAWFYSRGANVVVADIDWGFRTTHQEFQGGAIALTYNSVDGGQDVTSGAHAAHGTAVLGLIGARADGAGLAGYAPEATLWAIQGDSAPTLQKFAEPWAEAVDFVRRTPTANKRKVINLEVQTFPAGGNYEQVPSVHRAIRAAIAEGCVVCVAAGNGDRPADRTDQGEPFDPTGSILVGATAYHQTENKRAWFSNYGSRVAVSAPGDPSHDVTCGQAFDDAYRNQFGGTSGAAPKVAGTVALMLSVNPQLTHDDIREILTGTGMPVTEDPGKPIGVFLNAEAAVAEALRRRSETRPTDVLLTPSGKPVLEPPALHGVRRRRSQMKLPRESEGPILWDAEVEAEATAESAANAFAAQPPAAGDKTLRLFRESVEGTLTQQDRILLVAQAIRMLDNFYVHRLLKEAIHAVRPIQRLRVLQRRLQQATNIPMEEQDELAFHNTLTQIFNSVRDLHTNYQLPRPYRDYIAYLPFEVAPFYENNQRRYLVTRVVPGYSFADAEFKPGVELVYWNGMPIERAVRANAEETAGSNEAARQARGVSALTIRPMNTALPPDADFVDMEFAPPGANPNDAAERRAMRQPWFVRYAPSTAGGALATAFAPVALVSATVPLAAPTPSPIFAAQTSVDIGRESAARSSDLIFMDAPAPAAPAAPPNTSARERNLALAASLGLDTAADAVREARQLIFESTAIRTANRGESYGIRGSASPSSVADTLTGVELTVKHPWNVAFRARTVNVNGATYGHIHIRTFYVEDADGFVQEFIRLLEQMPENGLILDVRGNGGGNIWAAERLLQTLAAIEIEPERMQFIVTPGTVALSQNNPASSSIPLHLWLPSLEEAVETGAVYSHAFPLTDKESCNAIGQKYYGPVALIVDGNCYSATDIFAAGFQDHHIGKILGVSNNTGAGGANVWEHWLLNQTLPAGWGLNPLPNQAGMRVAIRQCLRVGPRAGALLEDFGVAPDAVHRPTREDVMEGDRKLMERAAQFLAEKKTHSIKVTMGVTDGATPGLRQVEIKTRGIRRLDFFLDERPQASRDLNPNSAGDAQLTPAIRIGSKLRLSGYAAMADQVPVAQYRGVVT